MHRIVALFCAFILLVGSLAVSPLAGSLPQAPTGDPWIARTNKVAFDPQHAADAPVQVDLPKKDWMALPSTPAVLLLLASRKGDAVVMVEQLTLAQPLGAADITEVFAQIEIDSIKEREPKATEFQSRVLDDGQRRVIAVQYRRPGVLGAERLRQYSIAVGRHLYHLTCISSVSEFGNYDPVFSHMAASFAAAE